MQYCEKGNMRGIQRGSILLILEHCWCDLRLFLKAILRLYCIGF